MKRIIAVFIAVVVGVLATGCGSLNAKIVTKRDLTSQELKFYNELDDDFKLICFYPVWTWAKFKGGDSDGMVMARMKGALNIPVPIIGCGYGSFSLAVFDEEGKRNLSFKGSGIAPLISWSKIKVREDGKWTTMASDFRLLRFFGFGSVNGKAMFHAIGTFGANESEMEAMKPQVPFKLE